MTSKSWTGIQQLLILLAEDDADSVTPALVKAHQLPFQFRREVTQHGCRCRMHVQGWGGEDEGGVALREDASGKVTEALEVAAAMMLEHCHLPHMAARLRTAIELTLNADNTRTGDLGGHATTAEFTRALVKRIANA